jgi:hypothetical protein
MNAIIGRMDAVIDWMVRASDDIRWIAGQNIRVKRGIV